jgi:hypothetical protein
MTPHPSNGSLPNTYRELIPDNLNNLTVPQTSSALCMFMSHDPIEGARTSVITDHISNVLSMRST